MPNRPHPLKVIHTSSGNITEHVALIHKQVHKSIEDPELRQLVVKVVSDSFEWRTNPRSGAQEPYIKAWGKWFKAPPELPCEPRDAECELAKVWNFVVLNVRYVYDPANIDTFATAKETLLSGGGDCFPVGTLVLRSDGALVPIESVQVGDSIHDGTSFVEVLKTWDRGLKPIHRLSLNNGDTLRLSDTHKVLVMPRGGVYGLEEEHRVADLKVGDDLLQPRQFGGGDVELSDDDAFLVGAYLAEGCKFGKKAEGHPQYARNYVSIAGVADSKGIRERVAQILTDRGVAFQAYERELRFKLADVPVLAELDLGSTAINKHLPHLDWAPKTAAAILAAMEQGDGGVVTNGANIVYSTISLELALQYRILRRMFGHSTSMTCLAAHGGAGKNPIYRVTARVNDDRRPWAKIKAIEIEAAEDACVDVMTTSGRVYLPESDVIVRQCDDFDILFESMLYLIGFGTKAQVVSVAGAPNEWVHVYPLVGLQKDAPSEWLALDATVTGSVPGWEYPDIAKRRAFAFQG